MSITIVGGGNPSGPTYPLQRSVRLRSSATAYFNRTLTTPTSSTTWTYSLWVKRGSLNINQQLLSAGAAVSDQIYFQGGGTDKLIVYLGATQTTTQVFRDPSSWYHFVFAIDTTQATASNRLKIYLNGNQITTFDATGYPTQNSTTKINSAVAHYIGRYAASASDYADGYLTEINFIDGQALTPTSFGAYNSYGVWSPAKYTGTYGTNGFYLNFQDNSAATAAAIGKDSSGNGNNWTPNNISVTAGVTYDSMLDVPTNISANNANFAVMSPITGTTNLSNGNLYLTGAGAYRSGYSTIAFPSTGKWYWEGVFTQANNNLGFGAASIGPNTPPNPLPNTGGIGITNGGIWYLDTSTGTSGHTGWSAATVVGMTWDSSSNTFAYTVDGTTYNTVGSVSTTDGRIWAPAAWAFATNDQLTLNFGQRPFTYTPRSGYIALNTYNLPAPTIPNGAKYMGVTLYTGNGGTQTLQHALYPYGGQPDLMWLKSRSAIANNGLFDSDRGWAKALYSNTTGAEVATAGVGGVDAANFTLGGDAAFNTNAATYVAWQWMANSGTNVINTSGSIPSTISANTTSGFSIVTYTGTGALATVGHGLGVAPKMIIVKQRNTTGDWAVYNANLSGGANNQLLLNSTAAAPGASTFWGNLPTSSVFSVWTSATTNTSGGTYVAYCWAEIPGFSKFGSYTGNGSADGPFVYCGFRPRWIMYKCTTAAENWELVDTSRNPYNAGTDQWLYPNLSNAEGTTSAGASTDILSNGFKLRGFTGTPNTSGATYIYAAFAENPFNYSLAR